MLVGSYRFSFVELFLPLFIILAPYSVLGISNFFFYIFLLYSFYVFFKKQKQVYIHKIFFLFVLVYTCVSSYSIIRRTSAITLTDINNFLMPWLIFWIISMTLSSIDRKRLYRIYAGLGSVAMIIMYVQALGLYVFNIPAVPITLLPVAPEDYHYWNYFLGERPSAFFTEPQAYASFMLPLLVLALNYKKHIYALLITFSILLSSSSQGILLAAIVYVLLLLKLSRWYYKMGLACLLGLVLIGFMYLPVFSYAKEKILATSYWEDNIRLTRGFMIYATFDTNDLLFGIGEGQQQKYVEQNLGFLPWVRVHANTDKEGLLGFSTTYARILISSGLVAFLFFMYFIFRLIKYEDRNMFNLLIILLIASFSQTLLFNSWFLFYYLLYWGCCDKINYSRNYYMVKFNTHNCR